MSRGQKALLACTVSPVIAMAINILFPPETNAYLRELSLILLLGLLALAISRRRANLAIVFFFSTALVPILIAMAQSPGDGQIVWALAPLVFILLITTITTSSTAVKSYMAVAVLANYIIGAIYQDIGLTVALCILDCGAGAAAVMWLGRDLQRAHKKLDELRGEASRLNQRFKEETPP